MRFAGLVVCLGWWPRDRNETVRGGAPLQCTCELGWTLGGVWANFGYVLGRREVVLSRVWRGFLVALVLVLGGAAVWVWAAQGQARAALGELSSAVERGGEPDGAWRRDSLWDDGTAEFSAYDVTWRRYGRLYSGRALLILVKEPWAPDLNVKADTPRADGFDVLKLNHVRDVATGIYTYHQMGSVYFRRDSGALVKIATTSSEACGVSTAFMVDGELQTRSYFDGQGARTQAYPPGALPEEGLHAMLRDYVRGDIPATLEVFPMLMTGRFTKLVSRNFKVERRAVGALRVPAGSFDAVEIVLSRGDEEMAFAFEDEPPFKLVRYRRSDGTEYALAKSERIAYWGMHNPGDEAWIPEHLRSVPGPSAP